MTNEFRLGKPQAAGVLYICTGGFGNWLRNSIASLQSTNPKISIFLLADRPYDISFQWVESWTEMASRQIKTQLFRYTPFELTLYVDADTVFSKSINLEEMLGDADIAFAICTDNPSLRQAAFLSNKYPNYVSPQEVEETLSLCGEDCPFLNGGVILWRKNVSTYEFFKNWHSEWLKYQKCDQFALVRALKKTKIAMKTLSSSYNSLVYEENCEKEAHIYHLLGKEPSAKRFGLWYPPAPGQFETAYKTAVENGLLAENQYQYIAREIHNHHPCNLLVIGNGCDNDFWSHCAERNLLYVLESVNPASLASGNRLEFEFKSRTWEWVEVPVPPHQVKQIWDYVLVQGPSGYDSRCPGRQIPIAWASQLARKAIFILDYDRPWERRACDHYLGNADCIVDANGRKDRKLAVYYINRE